MTSCVYKICSWNFLTWHVPKNRLLRLCVRRCSLVFRYEHINIVFYFSVYLILMWLVIWEDGQWQDMSLTERVSESMSEPITSARTSRGARGARGGAWPRTDWTPHANAPLGLRRRRLRAYIEIIVRDKNSGVSFVGNMRMITKKETRITRNDKNYWPKFLYRIVIQRRSKADDWRGPAQPHSGAIYVFYSTKTRFANTECVQTKYI